MEFTITQTIIEIVFIVLFKTLPKFFFSYTNHVKSILSLAISNSVKSTTHKMKTCGLVMNNQVLDVEAADRALPTRARILPSIGKMVEVGWFARCAMLTAAFQSASNTIPSLQ